jgi:hypothetical protein
MLFLEDREQYADVEDFVLYSDYKNQQPDNEFSFKVSSIDEARSLLPESAPDTDYQEWIAFFYDGNTVIEL